ncbi:hypothetical protein T440DRAFT_500551 [Plenodomus tracheiphilus IPT5]|uniref:Rhodopsin domain-containing protein n=1 Tax=Plenodomus tracheiphilus IPT5 TaxID=1408161 RepID=A0A6A7B1H4_9PLEO|nr:hypothetical protein T440DRAFT_500551 [Plenodomus tracheiphilus IPT5]
MILVPLKLWCRRRAGGWSNIGLDNYLTILSLLVANAFFWTCMIGMRDMLGRHVADLPDPMMLILYTCAIANIKLAVLAFYWRLFAVNARIAIWIVSGMCIAWFLAILLCVILNCVFVKAAWDITITNAKCIEIQSIYLGGSVPNVVIDLVVVLMPRPYFVLLFSSASQSPNSGDVTYNFREIIVWSTVEINIGLVCACLPSLKPSFAAIGLNRLFSFDGSRGSRISDNKSPGPSSGNPSRRFGGTYELQPRKKVSTGGLFSTVGGVTKPDSEEELKTLGGGYGKNQTEVAMARSSDDSTNHTPGSTPNNGINVQRDWSVYVDHIGARQCDGRIQVVSCL